MTVIDDVLCEIVSPRFILPPAAIWHSERVPSDMLDGLRDTWKRLCFPERRLQLRALRDVYVAEEGIVLRQDLSFALEIRGAHSDDDIARARAATESGRRRGTIPLIEGEVVLCRRPGTNNYGHWLVEMLPLAHVAAQHWPRQLRFMVQAADENLAGVMRQGLDRIGVWESLRLECGRAPVRVERLLVLEGLTRHGSYISPLVIDCLDRIGSTIPPRGAANIFVSRGGAPTRRLADEGGIVLRAAAQGFAALAPGLMDFTAQVAAFKAARRIVGVMGATLTNIAFAPRGSVLYALAPAAMPDTFYYFLCALRRIRFVDIRCHHGPPLHGGAPWDGELTLDRADEERIFADAGAPPAEDIIPDLNLLFDAEFYRSQLDSALPEGMDPLAHYCETGWREWRDPSPQFSTRGYAEAYPGIVEIGMNPLMHYIEHGRDEGRSIFPARK